MNPARCQCGLALGEACSNWLDSSAMVVVEYMPPQHRRSHETARNRGVYPANGALRLAVSPDCARLIIQGDEDWAATVPDAKPTDYLPAEED